MTNNQTTKVCDLPLMTKPPACSNTSVYATCYCVFHCMLPSWVRKSILFDLFWGTGQWPSPEPQTTWISGIFQQPEDCMLWWSFDIGVVFHELDKLTDFVQSGHSLFCALFVDIVTYKCHCFFAWFWTVKLIICHIKFIVDIWIYIKTRVKLFNI